MHRLGLALPLLLLAGCDVVLGLSSSADYPYRKRVRVTAPNDTTLVDFPLALIIRDDPELDAIVGADVAIRTADGADLAFDIDELDLASDSGSDLYAWVRVPALAPRTALDLYVYYGARTADPLPRVDADAWAAGYGAVWHFTDYEAGAQRDHTGNDNVLTPASAEQEARTVAGVLGHGLDFDGVDDTLAAPAHPSLEAADASFSYAVWVTYEPDDAQRIWDMPVYKGGASATVSGYDFELGTEGWVGNIADGVTKVDVTFEPVAPATWNHLVGVIDRAAGTYTVFLNGRAVGSSPVPGGSLTSDRPLQLSLPGVDTLFGGTLDELRTFHGVLSADWIATEYTNLTAPATMLEVAPREALR